MGLDDMRSRIDEIDSELVLLLNRRAGVAVAIGEEKSKQNSPVRDPEREHEVLERVGDLGDGPLAGQAIRDVFQAIITACRDLEIARSSE